MQSARRIRHQLYLSPELSERLERLAANPGTNKSAILEVATRHWLDRRGANELDEKFGARLDRLSRHLVRLERNDHIALESLALFVRYMLSVTAPLAQDDELNRSIGRDRFAAFVDRVGQQIATGMRTFGSEVSDDRH